MFTCAVNRRILYPSLVSGRTGDTAVLGAVNTQLPNDSSTKSACERPHPGRALFVELDQWLSKGKYKDLAAAATKKVVAQDEPGNLDTQRSREIVKTLKSS